MKLINNILEFEKVGRKAGYTGNREVIINNSVVFASIYEETHECGQFTLGNTFCVYNDEAYQITEDENKNLVAFLKYEGRV